VSGRASASHRTDVGQLYAAFHNLTTDGHAPTAMRAGMLRQLAEQTLIL
jgi:hypothetical protein